MFKYRAGTAQINACGHNGKAVHCKWNVVITAMDEAGSSNFYKLEQFTMEVTKDRLLKFGGRGADGYYTKLNMENQVSPKGRKFRKWKQLNSIFNVENC